MILNIMNIKIILLLSLTSYASCGNFFSFGNGEKSDYVLINIENDRGKLEAEQGFKNYNLILNGEVIPGGVFGKQDITINESIDKLEINKKTIPVNGNEELLVKYLVDGGITLNGKKIEGFDDIKAAGQMVLGVQGKKYPDVVFENVSVPVERNSNGLMIGGKQVPDIGKHDCVVVDFRLNGDILVNGKKLEGFDDVLRPPGSTSET